MSKKMNRRDFLKGTALTALGLAAAGVGTGALAEEKAGYIPGTYSATVKGMNDVTVTATFSESAITEVTVDTTPRPRASARSWAMRSPRRSWSASPPRWTPSAARR